MKKYNFLFYNMGEKYNYIFSSELLSYYSMLKIIINDYVLLSPSLGFNYINEEKFIIKDEFKKLYNNITEENLLKYFSKTKVESLKKYKYDYFIITYTWFSQSMKEAIIFSKFLKKYVNINLKTIYISEFPKFYEKEMYDLYREEFDCIISSGYQYFTEYKNDIVIKKVLSYGNIDKTNTYNFPLLDYSIIKGKTNMIEYQISRGCKISPKCFYCTISDIDNKLLKSINNIILDLKNAYENGIKYFYFIDGEINFNNKIIENILDKIIYFNLNIKWSSYILAKDLNENLIRKMYKSGCVHIRVGVESITKSRLNKISKNINIEEILNILKLFKKFNIKIQLHFLYGFKNEKTKELKSIIDFVTNNKNDFNLFDFFYIKFRPKVGSYNFGFNKFELPYIKDNFYIGKGGELKNYILGDDSIIDKKTKLFYNLCFKYLGVKEIANDPREYFLKQIYNIET